MSSPDTNPQSEEVARENQFHVELQQPELIYEEMSHKYLGLRRQYGLPIVIFGLGEAHSEDELFSAMNAKAVLSVDDNTNLYYLIISLSYQERNNAFWNAEQIDQLKELLTNNYNYSSIEHQVENRQHKLRVIDSKNKISYDLHVGYENEKTAWIGNLEAAAQLQNMLGDPQDLDPVLYTAFDNSRNTLNPPSVQSAIGIKTFSEDDLTPCDFSLKTGAEAIDNPEEIKAFINTSKKWAKFIEDAVNTMSKVKGIPQSGKLILHPPSKILQL